ncbi:MAG: DegT/DnrJ/EryC1/StrS aminotransferase family protein [Brumimicrobium sp.]|nr:DegT/DnrJ/EryC1/StrS aminotransferase family protein [Brumimicrobium sp.]
MIPFSPPRIDDAIIAEVTEVLKSGWITTGPRTKQFEKDITAYCGNKSTVCVNSWTMGMQVLLDWWGIGKGDEVILPAYTYCASGNVILHSGAKLVMVDIGKDDFNIDLKALEEAITPRTKAIIPVDIGGWPCDYDEIYRIIESNRSDFNPSNHLQEKLGRIVVFADAAHSFGGEYRGKKVGSLADATVFSFHAVKNLTTAEGGAICFNFPEPFDNEAIYKEFCIKILHGQSKDALAKTQKGAWKYDVEEPGYKCNMTDLQAAIGLIELRRYQENLDRRKAIFNKYYEAFKDEKWAINPLFETGERISSFHLYQLRIKNATEKQRDLIILEIAEQDVTVNVHFQPLPLLTAYNKRGYFMANYPESWRKYENEISLPVYFDLSDEQVNTVINAVKTAVSKILI